MNKWGFLILVICFACLSNSKESKECEVKSLEEAKQIVEGKWVCADAAFVFHNGSLKFYRKTAESETLLTEYSYRIIESEPGKFVVRTEKMEMQFFGCDLNMRIGDTDGYMGLTKH